jgi:hypothetical protein
MSDPDQIPSIQVRSVRASGVSGDLASAFVDLDTESGPIRLELPPTAIIGLVTYCAANIGAISDGTGKRAPLQVATISAAETSAGDRVVLDMRLTGAGLLSFSAPLSQVQALYEALGVALGQRTVIRDGVGNA